MYKIISFLLILCMSSFVIAKPWSEILHEKFAMLTDSHFEIMANQYQSFVNNTAYAIGHPVIKSVPIIDNEEPLIDIRYMHNSRLCMLPHPLEGKFFYGADYNSGLPCASKIRKELYRKLKKMISCLDELSALFGYNSGEVSIKVFEGLRDLKTQTKLFQDKLEEIKKDNPDFTEQEAELETSKWVSPVKNNVPPHSTGAAIDIRLWNETTHDFVDLGKFGVIWGENKAAPTFSEDITDAQKRNRLYLLMAASEAGLVNYTYEYWHFSCGDRYAVYWQTHDSTKRVACYGAVNG